ncbi:efflux RND transporter periplasmic adaptor subunit [Leptolyngbya iicbica]|uniref:HlyD family efflux transporter periplasmic adaptor subunit n=2 Tax=Cyanophyceae TaxID=3028117 RepID=A0A4Q7EFX0_9CYAN|nr:HlyD family efflux transporter periplasmic adaptor subunit [Leptolyngbya sp. LK]RZM81936.1 HlyD family efflux transporter periplasmic adaptor subunit [Leptolyngbya sp. LK]
MAHDTDLRQSAQPEAAESPTDSKSSRWSWRSLDQRWWYLLAGLGLVGLGSWALRPSPQRVDLVTVERGSLEVSVEAEGRTRVRDRFVVSAPVDGRLTRIELLPGDAVTDNQVVARIDPLPLTSEVQQAQARMDEIRAQMAGVETLRPKEAALQQAQSRITAAQAEQQRATADLARAEASLQQAQRDMTRANELAAQGAISEQQRESAGLAATARQQDRNAAQQQVASAEAAIAAARDDLNILQAEQQDPDYLLDVYQAEMASAEAQLARLADEARRTDIVAPAAGQVLRVLEESARFVTAGTPLLEIGDAAQLEIVIDVLSSDAVKIQPGDRIHLNQWGGDDTLAAQVTYLEPSAFTKVSALGVEEQRVNVIANFTNPDVPLGDSFRVDTQIVIDENPDALIIPISALFPCEPGTCVFTVENNRARQTTVEIGLRNTFDAEVTDGLAVGDIVIAYPESVDGGDRVQPR